MSGVKEAVLKLVEQLPEECTWDDVLYEIFVRQKVDAGLKDAEEGRTVPHEEVFQEFSHENNSVD